MNRKHKYVRLLSAVISAAMCIGGIHAVTAFGFEEPTEVDEAEMVLIEAESFSDTELVSVPEADIQSEVDVETVEETGIILEEEEQIGEIPSDEPWIEGELIIGMEVVDDTEGERIEMIEETGEDTYNAPFSGECGKIPGTVYWHLDDAGKLVVSGKGEMLNWESAENAPWYEHYTEIREVVVEEGVTSVGSYAFFSCDGLKTITIG